MASPPGDIGSPLQLLQGDFESSDQEIRLRAIKRAVLVAEAVGPDVTRDELIPYLASIVDDDDEILLAVAAQLAHFVPLIGGSAHAGLLLPILENLAGVDETVVREMAISSTCQVLSISEGHCASASFEMVKRLSDGDWFTARVSACGLFAASYKANAESPESRQGLRVLFEQLSRDETPMVRRAAASNIGEFASALEMDALSSEIVVILSGLASDEQDSVRQIAAEEIGKVAVCMVNASCGIEACSSLLPIFKKGTEDRSWRVRHSIAKCFPTLAKALGSAVFARELVAPLNALLQDIETEVRSQALKGAEVYVLLLGADAFVIQIMPSISALSQDVSLPVRTSLSDACMALAHHIGQDHTIRTILPMLQRFLRDDSSEVRLHILTKLEALADMMPAIADKLLPLVLELGHDNIWRVRRAVVLSIPMLAERLGADYFEEHLLDLYLQAYQDSVSDVRMGASDGLMQLCKVCGSEWICEKLLPRLKALYGTATFYLHRITILGALKTLLGEGSPASPTLANEVVELMLSSTRDSIPNVRFTAVRALQEVIPFIDDITLKSQVQPCLSELANVDVDNDVKFFASQALLVMK